MKTLFFLPLALLCMHSFAQVDNSAKYAEKITGAELRKHLTIIAGDEFEGRETGTIGQRKAAEYIETQFALMGLKKPDALKSYQQLYPLTQDSIAVFPLLSIKGVKAENGKDFLIPLSNNDNAKFRSNKLVFAGYGIDDAAYNDYANINVNCVSIYSAALRCPIVPVSLPSNSSPAIMVRCFLSSAPVIFSAYLAELSTCANECMHSKASGKKKSVFMKDFDLKSNL